MTKKTIQPLNAIATRGLSVFNESLYEIDPQAKDPEGIILRSYNLHDAAFGNQLKAIARSGAGVNNIPVENCTQQGIVVFNTPGANANAVKELVLTMLMASSRHLFEGISWTATLRQQGEQIPQVVEAGKKQFVGHEIKGKTLGVIGLGAIGASVANDALELGMDVIGYDPFISVDTAWNLSRNVKRAMSLEEMYRDADYLTVHVPLTDETTGMFNEAAFASMKKGVYLLNFSRGELVNEHDMQHALADGQVGKYMTDFPNQQVLEMPNVIAIPHLGASTEESEENCAVMAARQLRDYLETGNIRNSVNFPNAYLPHTGKTRVAAFHENVPNMVGQMTSVISRYNLNIADMVNRSRGSYAYTMIDLDHYADQKETEGLHEALTGIAGMVRVRVI